MRNVTLMSLGVLLLVATAPLPGLAQDHHAGHDQMATQGPDTPGHQGRHGVGHEMWHEKFYSKLMRKDTKTSCCNLSDCVPTQSRMVDDHYEVMVEGEWTAVPQSVIQNVTAPD